MAKGEDWPGYTGGNQHQNASSTNISPVGIGKLWQRSFLATLDIPPKPPARTAGCRGSQNLVKNGNFLALIGNDSNEQYKDGAVAILDTTRNGETVNNINVQCRKSDEDYANFFYPTGIRQVVSDVGRLQQMLFWDPKTGILYVNSGGSGIYASAYKPLANLQSYTHQKRQPGVPAFEGLPRKWLSGGEHKKDFPPPKDPSNPDAPDPDLWFTWDNNSTAYYEIDPEMPLVAITRKWHEQRGWLYFVNKRSGIFIPGVPRDPANPHNYSDWRYDDAETETKPVNTPPYSKPIKHLNPFGAMGGVRLANGRIFMMGPSDDNNKDGELGDTALYAVSSTVEIEASKKFKTSLNSPSQSDRADDPDQGLYLWACKVSVNKSGTGNGSLPGDAAVDQVRLEKAFVYRFSSDHQPMNGLTDADSYLETDFFYRKKAWLVDGIGVWAAWKPGKRDGVELIHADDSGAQKYDLLVGRGLQGQDIWPHLSLTSVNQHKYIVYYFGNALRREAVGDKPFLAIGTFARETSPPAGPAEMAVFDATSRKLRYTFNLSAAFPSMEPNDEWRYYDRSQMVVAGKYAWVAWVDLTKLEASLHMACFDITADQATPVESTIPLGFPSANNRRSGVTDLIASDGKLYALVTQSDLMGPNDPTWDAQHVICVGSGAPTVTGASTLAANAFKPVYPPERKHAELPSFLEDRLKKEFTAFIRSINDGVGKYRAQAITDAMYQQYINDLPDAFVFTQEELEKLKNGRVIVDMEDVIKTFDQLSKKTDEKQPFLGYEKNRFDHNDLDAVQTALFYKITLGKLGKINKAGISKAGKTVSGKTSEVEPLSTEPL